MIEQMYQVKRKFRSEFVPIRNLQYHVQVWGEPSPDKTPLVMVHGWMDVAASYQFVVDAFAQDHYIIAPDWCGVRKTPSGNVDNYWFPGLHGRSGFFAGPLFPRPTRQLGRPQPGGNVVMLYWRRAPRAHSSPGQPGRFWPARHHARHGPARYAKWMDELKKLHRGEMDLRAYDAASGVARRLMKTNPRLTQDKADWLARHWAEEKRRRQQSPWASPRTRSSAPTCTNLKKCWSCTAA